MAHHLAHQSAKRHRGLLILLLLCSWIIGSTAAWAGTEVTWDTKEDFESNASTVGTPTTRSNIDTTTVTGSVKIGVTKELLSTAAITITDDAANRIYSTGANRLSVAVIDKATSTLLTTIPLTARPSGVVFNPTANKLYVGQYNSNKVVVVDCSTSSYDTTELTVGEGAYAALYNANKVYVLNMTGNTVSIINGDNNQVTNVSVVAGPYIASASGDKVYITNKYNNSISVINSDNSVDTTVTVDPVAGLLGGTNPEDIGLRVDAAAKGINSSDHMFLKAKYGPLSESQKIQLQIRTATNLDGLATINYRGPDNDSTKWYELPSTASSDTEVTIDLGIAYAPAAELQFKLSSNDTNTSPVLDKVTLVYAAYPDLTITNVNGPATGIIGSLVTVDTTAFNQGSEPAGPFNVCVNLTSITTNTSYLLGKRAVTSLAANSSDVATSAFTIPTLPTGSYYIEAVADCDNQVLEGYEDNNVRRGNQIDISSVLPDLVVTDISGSVNNGIVTYSVTIKNQGTNVANSPKVGIYLSTDANITTSDTLITAPSVGRSLSGGQVWTLSGTASIPVDLQGDFYIGAIADYNGIVIEADETNNSLATTYTTNIFNDLVITAISGSVVGNGTISYSATIKNIGNGVTGIPKIGIYLSTDAIITTSDTLITAPSVGRGLFGGQEWTLSGTATIPVNLQGDFYIGAIADYNDTVPEAGEASNSLVTTYTIHIFNDLVITAISGSVVGNGTISYSATIKNIGNGVTGIPKIGIYLSTDAILTTSDTLITAPTVGRGLFGGQEWTLSGTATIPVNLQGDFYIGAIADYNDTVPEEDETNNWKLTPYAVNVYNDLVISPLTATVGSTVITYSATVGNIGNGIANYSKVGFYISDSPTSLVNSLFMGSVTTGTGIVGGATKVFTGSVNIPSTRHGDVYFVAVADYLNEIPESLEDNNLTSVPITLP